MKKVLALLVKVFVLSTLVASDSTFLLIEGEKIYMHELDSLKNTKFLYHRTFTPEVTKKLIEYAEQTNDSKLRLVLKRLRGEYYFEVGQLSKATENLEEAAQIAEILADTTQLIEATHMLAVTHSSSKQFQYALYLSDKVLELTRSNKNSISYINAHCLKGMIYEETNELEKSKYHLEKAVKVVLKADFYKNQSIPVLTCYSLSLISYAKILKKFGETECFETCVQNIIRLSKNTFLSDIFDHRFVPLSNILEFLIEIQHQEQHAVKERLTQVVTDHDVLLEKWPNWGSKHLLTLGRYYQVNNQVNTGIELIKKAYINAEKEKIVNVLLKAQEYLVPYYTENMPDELPDLFSRTVNTLESFIIERENNVLLVQLLSEAEKNKAAIKSIEAKNKERLLVKNRFQRLLSILLVITLLCMAVLILILVKYINKASKEKRSKELLILKLNDANSKLKQSNKNLSYVNNELFNFSSMLGNELNKPLGIIEVTLSDIKTKYKALFSSYDLTSLHLAHDTSVQIKKLVTSLLEYSKFTNNVKGNRHLDLLEIVNDSVHSILFDSNNPRIELDIKDESLGQSLGDPDLTRSLFYNILLFIGRIAPADDSVKITIHKAEETPEQIILCFRNPIGSHFYQYFEPKVKGPTFKLKKFSVEMNIASRILHFHGGKYEIILSSPYETSLMVYINKKRKANSSPLLVENAAQSLS